MRFVSQPNASVEVLNPFLVTHPKNIGDKKSHYLRSLRCENHESDTELNGFDASCSGPTSPAQDSEKVVNIFVVVNCPSTHRCCLFQVNNFTLFIIIFCLGIVLHAKVK